ncbi:MAG: hypothetical protein IJP23_05745 [Oscillospiraceae bacterium]|nr:hypothetical protein [Oscillospiraceae bacterium]
MKKIFSLVLAAIIAASALPALPALAAEKDNPQHRIEDMSERFDDLTDAQKRKIYKLDSRACRDMAELARLYGQYGLMEKDEADKIAELITERSQLGRLQGRLPGIAG